MGAAKTAAAAAPQLDEFDRTFWAAKVKAFMEADAALRAAQAKGAIARADLEGYAKYVKEKYALPDDTEITPDGTVVRRSKEA